jgi:hypothetical protein
MAQSLFGLTPEQIQQARQLQQQQAINQQAQSFGMFGPLYAASRGLSQTGINALAQGLFPEAQDPALRRATTTQSIVDKYKGQNINDPMVLTNMATEFSNAGFPELALQLGEEANKRKPKSAESPFAKINPKDYTPESVRQFAQTGNYEDLVSVEKPTAKYRTLTTAEARSRGLDPNMTYQLEEGTNKVSQIGQGPSVVFNAPLVGAEKAYASVVGTKTAEADIGLYGAAEAAVDNLPKINEILSELQKGDAFTGIFAETQKNIQKAQAKFAADKKAGKRVTDTEYLQALLGSEVFPMIGALGIGARGLDTPAEREFLLKVMTGEIGLERETLIRMANLRKGVAEKTINKFNERVDNGDLNNFFKYRGTEPRKFVIPKEPISKPPEPASQAPESTGQWRILPKR